MRIYLDADFRCHLEDGEGLRACETDVFDGKCASYTEGFRFIPAGETWTRADDAVFAGEMIAPVEDFAGLMKAQRQYEADEAAHLEELGALIEEIYNEDMEEIANV